MENRDVRRKAAGAGVKLWEVAQELGITDASFSRKLRRELAAAEKAKIFEIVARLADRAEEGAGE